MVVVCHRAHQRKAFSGDFLPPAKEVATVNSSLELTMGSSSKEKPTATRALTVATRCPPRHARKEVAQGSLFSLAAFPPRRGLGGAARENSDYGVCDAAKTRTAGKGAGPQSGPCTTRPDPDVRKTLRSERAVNDALRLVIELREVGSYKRRDYSSHGA